MLSKRFGTRNKLVNAQATILALKKLKPLRGKAAQAQEVEGAAPSPEKGQLEVKQMTRKDAENKVQEQRRAKIEE